MFQGFDKQTIEFFTGLGLNNMKSWFEAHRADYEEFVVRPLTGIVEETSRFLNGLDPSIEVPSNPRRSIARIHRDTRFSKDKSPYRTNLWVTFKRPLAGWKTAPLYYFEIFPDRYWYGMGFFEVPPELRERLTDYVLGHPDEFRDGMRLLSQSGFTLGGDRYKRPIRPGLPGDVREFCERKSHYIFRRFDLTDEAFDRRILERMQSDFGKIFPLYEFFWNMIG